MPAHWHAILAAVEVGHGVWTLTAQYVRTLYGRVEIRRAHHGIRYRAELRGEIIRWATSLRLSLENLHARWIRSRSPGGAPPSDSGVPYRREAR